MDKIAHGDNISVPVVERSTQDTPDGALYPASYADDVARIDREMDAEEAGAKKPSRNEKLAAARVAAFQRGDFAIVQSLAPYRPDARAPNERLEVERSSAKGSSRPTSTTRIIAIPTLTMTVRS